MRPTGEKKVNCVFICNPTPEQIRQIVALYRAQGWWGSADEDGREMIPKLVSGSHCFAVALDGERVIGMGRAISDGVSDAYIQDLTVLADQRNRGIGRMILRALVARLHADGLHWIGLIAEPGSSGLYRREGFRERAGWVPMFLIEES
jgi:spermidine synthase